MSIPPYHREDYIEHALEGLPGHLQGLANYTAYLTALVGEIQEVEDACWSLIADRMLDSAKGAQLEQYGELLTERRDGLADDDYRAILRAKIASNTSEGTPEDLIKVATLAAGATRVVVWEVFPATVILDVYTTNRLSANRKARVDRLLQRSKPAGVKMWVVEVPDVQWFAFDDPASGGFNRGLYATVLGS